MRTVGTDARADQRHMFFFWALPALSSIYYVYTQSVVRVLYLSPRFIP